ncbi:MAG: hypothetical protein ACLSH6_02345 [Limosilactobacillus pontis]
MGMLKSTVPAPQTSHLVPITIDMGRGATTIDDYVWIECRNEGGRLANRNVQQAVAAQRSLMVCRMRVTSAWRHWTLPRQSSISWQEPLMV